MTTSQEAALARQAAKRGGVFTRAQAGRLGIAPSTLDRRLRSGVLMERHPGVLQAATSPYDPEAQEWAALLAAGPGAMLSHPSAGALWLPEVVERPSLPWVTIPFAARYRRLQGVEVVRSRHVEGVLRWRQGRPVTAPARTWVDLGRVLTDEALGSALAAGLQRRHFTLGDVERVLSVAHHRAGTQAVRRVLPQYRPEWESYLSALFGRLQEEAGLG
ncbi:MAG TPA: type IV toxin-antitoxin system AbiEi family antitoxin domain-containing protein, partial [Mycobacteriales bacterium]|nr:type IV toxin-antitoxin system AbiEi family antitoxin domain-containing protein [Mycobacteriales bacterium]